MGHTQRGKAACPKNGEAVFSRARLDKSGTLKAGADDGVPHASTGKENEVDVSGPDFSEAIVGLKVRRPLNARCIRFAFGGPRFPRTKSDFCGLLRTIGILANFRGRKGMR